MNRLSATLIPAFLALAAAGVAGERLPVERVHQAPETRERMPENLTPMDETELADTRGVVDAPEVLSLPGGGEKLPRDDEALRQQQADRAALIVELDNRIQETSRALQNAPEEARPGLQQRFQNLNTLRQGF